MNTSGERINSALCDLEAHAEPLTAHIEDGNFAGFAQAGEEWQATLAAVVHGEVDGRGLDTADMRDWLRSARQVIELAKPVAAGAALQTAVRHAVREQLCARAGLADDADEPTDLIAVIEMCMVGADILILESIDSNFFPAVDESTEEHGMAAVRESIGTESSATAAIFLAHALQTYMGLFFDRLFAEGSDVPADLGPRYRWVRDRALDDVLPLSRVDQLRIAQCSHVYRVFDGLSTREGWPEVPGYRTPSCLITALELHGDDTSDPDDYLSLLEGTRRTAEAVFVFEALKHAVHIAIGVDAYAALADGMVVSDDLTLDFEWWLTVNPKFPVLGGGVCRWRLAFRAGRGVGLVTTW